MKDIYWYYEEKAKKYYIGERGGKELVLDRHEMDGWYYKLWHILGRSPSDEEALKYAFKMQVIESQYVDFEEVKPEIKLLS